MIIHSGSSSYLFKLRRIFSSRYVTPHHQMRHKSEIQKLSFLPKVIEENIGFIVVKKICLLIIRS